ncbi:hypothetical protein MMC18_005599 [Xylographa bjoerkii]|nr:hypothetical protein [Xylographa bjoerkii]
MDALERYKATVLQGFHQETKKLEDALQEVLRLHDTASPQDHVALRIELEALRQYPEKVGKLEQENVELRSKLERAARRTEQSSEKSRPATRNTVNQDVHKQTEPGIQQSINAANARTRSIEPVFVVSDPEAVSRWLRACFEEDLDSEISQVRLRNAYASYMDSLSSASKPLPSEKELLSLVVQVFPDACIQLDSGITQRHHIKGIKFQHAYLTIQRLQQIVKEKDRNYATLVEKHFKLLGKSLELKKSVKSWQAYYDQIVSVSQSKRQTADNTSFVGTDDDQSGVYTPSATNTQAFDNGISQHSPNEHKACSSTSVSMAGSLPKHHIEHLAEPVGVATSDDLNQEVSSTQPNTYLPIDHSYASDGSTQPASSPTVVNNNLVAGSVSAVAIAVRDDLDTPIVISERSLKRKRQKSFQHGIFPVHEDACRQIGSSGKPIFVKSEPGSSPVLPSKTCVLNTIHDTLDLDEVGDIRFTPMKRNKLREVFHPQKANIHTLQDSSSLRLNESVGNAQIEPDRSAEDVDIMLYDKNNNNVRAYFDNVGDEYKRRLLQQHLERSTKFVNEVEHIARHVPTHMQAPQKSRIAKQNLHNQKANSRQNRLSTNSHNGIGKPKVKAIGNAENPVIGMSYRGTTGVLQPITPNVQVLPRTGIQAYGSKVSSFEKRRGSGSVQIQMLSEDGECDPTYRPEGNMSTKQSISAISGSSDKASTVTSVHHRLGGLLSGPSSEKPTLMRGGKIAKPGRLVEDTPQSFHKSPTTEIYQSHSPIISPEAVNTINLEGEKSREPVPLARTRPSTYVGTTHVSMREERPLRARAVHSLRLDDFKHNPAIDHGVDFAFNQVIRNQEQRKCLPNCTKPGCCGDKFHQMVRIGGVPVPHTRGLWDSSQVDEAEQEFRLLQDYTNLNMETLESMSTAEKNMLLEQVKAQKFGSEYGRHRHAHERAASPPGFWRTEMPTTQEVEGDKRKALAVEREKIEERYREATKGTGKWIFRDE